jgi:hypothetical protein
MKNNHAFDEDKVVPEMTYRSAKVAYSNDRGMHYDDRPSNGYRTALC